MKYVIYGTDFKTLNHFRNLPLCLVNIQRFLVHPQSQMYRHASPSTGFSTRPYRIKQYKSSTVSDN